MLKGGIGVTGSLEMSQRRTNSLRMMCDKNGKVFNCKVSSWRAACVALGMRIGGCELEGDSA